MVERVLQIAAACLSEYYELPRRGSNANQPNRQPQDLLENIYYFRVCSYTEQIAAINYLGKFIKEHKEVSHIYFAPNIFFSSYLAQNWSGLLRILLELRATDLRYV